MRRSKEPFSAAGAGVVPSSFLEDLRFGIRRDQRSMRDVWESLRLQATVFPRFLRHLAERRVLRLFRG